MTERKEDATGATNVSPGEVHRRLLASYGDVLAGRLDDALALIAPDVIDYRGGRDGDHRGRDAWRRKWEGMAAGGAFHDVSVTVEQNVASGDFSVNRYTLRGTHTATGRRYEVLGMDMIRVRDGKVVEHWALQDQIAKAEQLGLDV